ncbi:MAG: sigma 54-interacting transcriptional regulator [Pirellulaceae bacterium]
MELDFRKNIAVFENIIDTMMAGVFTVDAKGSFVAWNKGAEQITGYRASELIGQPCTLLEGENCKGFGSLKELLGDVQTMSRGICNQECKILSKDGREIHIHGNVQLLRDENDNVAGAVGCFMDVTSLVLANQKIEVLQRQAATGYAFEQLIGNSDAMREVFRQLKLAADSDVAVVLTGESGTGKELAARAIHAQSARSKKPFLAINCSAIPETLLESELFGHVKGSFTDATNDKLGIFEVAEGGTLFLDEIGDVSPAIQVKLLRVLQEREIRRIGDSKTRKVDVRVITATNRDLKQLVNDGKIREDFYYRIHVFEIRLPPLRERKDDIPLLVDHFVRQICTKNKGQVTGIAKDTLDVLVEYSWPGNVRELRNAIEHACVTAADEDRIGYFDLPRDIRGDGDTPENSPQLNDEQLSERARIVDALRQTGGNRTKAAKRLGTSRVTLWKKISRYGISVD